MKKPFLNIWLVEHEKQQNTLLLFLPSFSASKMTPCAVSHVQSELWKPTRQPVWKAIPNESSTLTQTEGRVFLLARRGPLHMELVLQNDAAELTIQQVERHFQVLLYFYDLHFSCMIWPNYKQSPFSFWLPSHLIFYQINLLPELRE